MDETGYLRFPGHHLDPTAQEFFPTTASAHVPLLSPQIYYSCPYRPPPFCEYSMPPAYVSTVAVEPPPPAAAAATAPLLQTSLPPPMMTPSRALLLSLVPADVSESIVRRELEAFGDVRAVHMDRVRDGIVTVHFYDLRHAQTALVEIQEQHMQQQCRLRRHYDAVLAHNSFGFVPPPPIPPPARGLISGRAVWAQFTIPVFPNIPDGCNQGTLIIFNLDPNVSPTSLQQMFEPFGPVRELRDTPLKKHQRFVEFYDTRDASKAMAEMNGKEINGKRLVIQFSRPGGHSKRFSKANNNYINSNINPSVRSCNKFNSMNNYTCWSSSSRFSPPPPATPPSTSQQRKVSISRKSSFPRNPNGNGGNKSLILQDSMAALSVDANGDAESSSKMNSLKKNPKKGNNSGGVKQQDQQHKPKGSNRPWRGSKQAKDYDHRFLINEDAIMESNCRDSRTTLMIKNIPNKYSQKLLLNMLDNHCIHCNEQIADGDDQPLSSYDFVYLPIDFINKCNVGYGFVNMTSPEATWRLYKAFHLRSWEVFNSRKICEVTYARLQGVEALQDHFKNSKFPCDADEYLPVIFSPPRDGRHLAEPVPIVGRNSIDPPPRLSSSSPFSSNQDPSETSYDNNEAEDEMDGQDLLEQEVNDEDGQHIDGGGRNSNNPPNGGDNEDYNDNDDV